MFLFSGILDHGYFNFDAIGIHNRDCPVYIEWEKKMQVTSVPCPAMYYTDTTYRSNQIDMPKHKRNCTEKGQLTYVTNSKENNLCFCEVNFSLQSIETYCDPSFENCTCQRNTSHDKNRDDGSGSWETDAIVVTVILAFVIIVIIAEIKKEDKSDIYENDDDSNVVDVAQSGVFHPQSVFHCVQETIGDQGPNFKDRYYGDDGDVGGYAESPLLPSGRLTGNSGKVQASIGSPDVGTDDVFTGNKNNVIPMESAMRTLGAETNHELSTMIQCDGKSYCEEPFKTLNARTDNGEIDHINDL
ncbi:unnamed protein product [Mytilus coruscus]|uniref:Uncharacterized protein n=1 Tax=Mytilus coruscus TaxID=42192 RepID=A0A6J8BKQ2_MYTCO|nr:unnamed protein product [Mytilus coruscus]